VTSGLEFSANGTNLRIDRSSGSIHRAGLGWLQNGYQNPNNKLFSAAAQVSFIYVNQFGAASGPTQDVIPDRWDDGGIYQTAAANDWIISRIFQFINDDLVAILPGQRVYGNESSALDGLGSDTAVVPI
jgi:hypothetical protein